MTQRLDKVLAHLGIGSRKDIQRLAKAGLVSVNGAVVTDSSFKFDPETATLEVDGEHLHYQTHYHLIMHKPAGYITSRKDKDGLPITVLIPQAWSHLDLSPVGRLDKDTEGLLLLTTDGEFLHRLTHPRWKIPKRYYVELEQPIAPTDAAMLASGTLELDGDTLQPAELVTTDNPKAVYLIIREGKFHQVKRMFHLLNNQVTYLKRVAMGEVLLPSNLLKGEVRLLNPQELLELKTAVGLTAENQQ